jgi:hypothetical protein
MIMQTTAPVEHLSFCLSLSPQTFLKKSPRDKCTKPSITELRDHEVTYHTKREESWKVKNLTQTL